MNFLWVYGKFYQSAIKYVKGTYCVNIRSVQQLKFLVSWGKHQVYCFQECLLERICSIGVSLHNTKNNISCYSVCGNIMCVYISKCYKYFSQIMISVSYTHLDVYKRQYKNINKYLLNITSVIKYHWIIYLVFIFNHDWTISSLECLLTDLLTFDHCLPHDSVKNSAASSVISGSSNCSIKSHRKQRYTQDASYNTNSFVTFNVL